MNVKWLYGSKCSTCEGKLGKRRCRGMCSTCYDRWYKRTHPEICSKENRRVVSAKLNWESDTYLGLKPSSHDWARLAAYIDGEGSIGLSPRVTGSGRSLTLCGKVVVTNTDPRLAEWCLETFGMKFYAKGFGWNPIRARERNWKPCYFSQATAYRASWICLNCLPWFLLKMEQAQIVLDHQKTTKAGTWERGSGITTPKSLLDYRMSLKNRLRELNKRGPVQDQLTDIVNPTDTIN